MKLEGPRVVIAGLSGDSGKTLVTLGLLRSLSRRGLTLFPYKKGPDYIDAAWLGAAVGRPGRNLDTFLMEPGALGRALCAAAGADLVVVEGNRGLHDGADAAGTHSTAALARSLAAPVILVVDATKATRTLAACAIGCVMVDRELDLAGVILNRVANGRQERVVRDAFRAMGAPPVLGCLPRLSPDPLPSRHLGLVTACEHAAREEAIERAAETVSSHVDLDGVLCVASRARVARFPDAPPAGNSEFAGVRVGVLRDEAFSFYYPENLETLEAGGAEIIELSPLHDRAFPPHLDALYAGGGFPEIHAAALCDNQGFRSGLRSAARDGLPIYAECGGLMYLARELRVAGRAFPMAGVLDLVVAQTGRPQGHGYVEARVEQENPFFRASSRLRGHEFHYSRPLEGTALDSTVLRLERGTGAGAGRDGVVSGRVWASYLHLHALGTPDWARGLLALAGEYRDQTGAHPRETRAS